MPDQTCYLPHPRSYSGNSFQSWIFSLGVFSESFIMRAQLLRLKRQRMLSSEVLLASTDSLCSPFPLPLPSLRNL